MRCRFNIFVISIAAGILFAYGILLTPAVGPILMSASTIIFAFNSRFLRMKNKKSRFKKNYLI
ncbi:hypothetical protein [Methanobacterium spitsbergense]|uniref:Uncharacterized protein n=1 Tax=Methanobacterium spitsbergense TaxID=2874285 RepID=A0A8T5UTM8_9EURY|nr:hypothetical protein [Methanobacterium spitsbergense]MBZ2167064.1 hypothetical protein [Methanobacterium spitsbergense]